VLSLKPFVRSRGVYLDPDVYLTSQPVCVLLDVFPALFLFDGLLLDFNSILLRS
tara:strand:- start:3662 stop:3823 length:162 start_codon:yes stop_codon:yes gene_type:complete